MSVKNAIPGGGRGAAAPHGFAHAGDAADGADPALDDAGEAETRESVVDAAGHGQRVDKVLVAMAPEFSRTHLQQLLDRGLVQVDGRPAGAASRRMRAGQRLSVRLEPTAESQAFRPESMALRIVHEDDDLLVIEKPPGLVVHPAAGNWSGTLLNGLLAHHGGASRLPRAGIVHRLDKDTSGLMLVGKSLPAVTALVRQIGRREVHRRYLALVHGVPPQTSWRIDLPVGRDPRTRVRMAVVPEAGGGRSAQTDVKRVDAGDGVALLSCTLHTGRTHQIRVHLSAGGWPLVGDATYGGRAAFGMARQALHATELSLAHPTRGDRLSFTSRVPADFAQALQQAGLAVP